MIISSKVLGLGFLSDTPDTPDTFSDNNLFSAGLFRNLNIPIKHLTIQFNNIFVIFKISFKNLKRTILLTFKANLIIQLSTQHLYTQVTLHNLMGVRRIPIHENMEEATWQKKLRGK